MPKERPTQIPLSNDWDAWFMGVRVRGELDDTLDLRAFISEDRNGVPIHAALISTAQSQGNGDYMAPFLGANLATHLSTFLHRRVWVVGESVPAGTYREAFPVIVVEDQGA